MREVSGRGLLRDKQLGFRPKDGTSVQLAILTEKGDKELSRKEDERRAFPPCS